MQHVRSYCPPASEVHPPASGQRGSKGPAGCRAAAHSAAEAPPPRCGVSLAQGHCRRARGAACGLYTSPEGSPSGFDAWKRHSIWRREGEQPLKSSCGLLALDLPQQSSTRSCGRACKGEVRREPAPNWWLSLGPVLTSGWGILAWLPPHPPPLLWVQAQWPSSVTLHLPSAHLSPQSSPPALAVTSSQSRGGVSSSSAYLTPCPPLIRSFYGPLSSGWRSDSSACCMSTPLSGLCSAWRLLTH